MRVPTCQSLFISIMLAELLTAPLYSQKCPNWANRLAVLAYPPLRVQGPRGDHASTLSCSISSAFVYTVRLWALQLKRTSGLGPAAPKMA